MRQGTWIDDVNLGASTANFEGSSNSEDSTADDKNFRGVAHGALQWGTESGWESYRNIPDNSKNRRVSD